MKYKVTIVESRHGYNVQVMADNSVVIANASDGVLSIAERHAEQQVKEHGIEYMHLPRAVITL